MKTFKIYVASLIVGTAAVFAAENDGAQKTFAERLSWKPSDVVVILHVDDVGMSHASNRGAIESIEHGVATSFSVMMPCPWVPEIAKYLKQHPTLDCGLHLTLTSEWELYRWPPLAGKPKVPGLVDAEGCLWRGVAQVAAHASLHLSAKFVLKK